jgi:3-dehydroquinate synthetase
MHDRRAIFAADWTDVGLVQELAEFRRTVTLADSALPERFVVDALRALLPASGEHRVLRVDVGRKSLAELTPIWNQLIEFVPDAVVGIGGGTLGDLVGFAASTYQRGVPHALVPTTTLAMLDASIGGKTGIDIGGVKNAVGSIHHPHVVVNVISALRTLPEPEVRSGLAEAVKAAVLFDEELFASLECLDDLAGPALLDIAVRASTLKMRVVEGNDRRKLTLLYGHAVGHGLELSAEPPMRHGDAVAIGLTVEGALGSLLGRWPTAAWHRQTRLLEHLGLPTSPPVGTSWKTVAERMRRYRKLVTGTRLAFVLPASIGSIGKDALTYVEAEDFDKALADALSLVVPAG